VGVCPVLRYSVIYIQNVDETPKVRKVYWFGNLTDESKDFGSGSFIQELVYGGLRTTRSLIFALYRKM